MLFNEVVDAKSEFAISKNTAEPVYQNNIYFILED